MSVQRAMAMWRDRRASVKALRSSAYAQGYVTGYGPSLHMDRQNDPFGNNYRDRTPFSIPSHQEQLESESKKARAAGVSKRKINKITKTESKAGFGYGREDAAYGVGKPSPFKSVQRYQGKRK